MQVPDRGIGECCKIEQHERRGSELFMLPFLGTAGTCIIVVHGYEAQAVS